MIELRKTVKNLHGIEYEMTGAGYRAAIEIWGVPAVVSILEAKGLGGLWLARVEITHGGQYLPSPLAFIKEGESLDDAALWASGCVDELEELFYTAIRNDREQRD